MPSHALRAPLEPTAATRLQYEVVWDGAHRGDNADLLVTIDVPHPRPPGLEPSRPRDASVRRHDVAAFLSQAYPFSFAADELAAMFACEVRSINGTLYRLSHLGLIKRVAANQGSERPRRVSAAFEWQGVPEAPEGIDAPDQRASRLARR